MLDLKGLIARRRWLGKRRTVERAGKRRAPLTPEDKFTSGEIVAAARAAGYPITRNNLDHHQNLEGPLTRFPEPRVVLGLAAGLQEPAEVVVAAAALSCGTVRQWFPDAVVRLTRMVDAGMQPDALLDALETLGRAHLVDGCVAFVEDAQGDGDVIDLVARAQQHRRKRTGAQPRKQVPNARSSVEHPGH